MLRHIAGSRYRSRKSLSFCESIAISFASSQNVNLILLFPCDDILHVLLVFSLTVKAATLIFISGCGSAVSSTKEGKSGFIYNLVKS